MLQTVKITSKRQITIPAQIFHLLNLEKGDRLLIEANSHKMIMQKAQLLLDELAGSLKIPKKYKNKSLEKIVKEAKKEYFQRRS